jgi:uncharacterized membrane protein
LLRRQSWCSGPASGWFSRARLSQTWVWLGLALFGVSLIIGVAYYAPQSSKILAALEAGDSEAADRRTKRFDIMVRLDMLVLIAIMAVMVFKPGAPA